MFETTIKERIFHTPGLEGHDFTWKTPNAQFSGYMAKLAAEPKAKYQTFLLKPGTTDDYLAMINFDLPQDLVAWIKTYGLSPFIVNTKIPDPIGGDIIHCPDRKYPTWDSEYFTIAHEREPGLLHCCQGKAHYGYHQIGDTGHSMSGGPWKDFDSERLELVKDDTALVPSWNFGDDLPGHREQGRGHFERRTKVWRYKGVLT